MFLSKEARQKIKKAQEEIIYEEKKRKELLNKEVDYNFLQSLMDKCNNNPDLVIEIRLKSGDIVTLKTKYKEEKNYSGYDGNPIVEEIR